MGLASPKGRGGSDHHDLPPGATVLERTPGFEKDPDMAFSLARQGGSANLVRIVGGFTQKEAEEIVLRETPHGKIGPGPAVRRRRRFWHRFR